MAGSVNNVNDYAPPGYKLAASHYADGKCTHVFSAEGLPDVELVVGQHEDERHALHEFVAKYTHGPLDAAQNNPPSRDEVLAHVAAHAESFATPAPAPKPAKRKGGNSG